MLALVCVLGLMGAPAPGENLEMRMQNGLWDVEARNVPLSSILDRLSHDTGMRIIHLGPPPSERVSAHLERATLAEVLEQLLKRHAYAERLDQTATQVELLVLAGSAGTVETTSPPGAPKRIALVAAVTGIAPAVDLTQAPEAASDSSQKPSVEPPRIDPSPVVGNLEQSSTVAGPAAPSPAPLGPPQPQPPQPPQDPAASSSPMNSAPGVRTPR